VTTSVAALRRDTTFPLFAIHPRHWSGPAFLANVARERGVRGLHTVQFAYLDGPDGGGGGATVSNLEAGLVTGDRGIKVDAFEEHLLNFVARFERGFLKRFLRSGATPLEPGSFDKRDLMLMVAGAERGAYLFRHKDLPLEFVRTAVRVGDGITDLVIAGWGHNARDLCAIVEPVTDDMAAALDGEREQYPPPDWDPTGST
jgi:hypothetical protein